jgi:hypothetical protein
VGGCSRLERWGYDRASSSGATCAFIEARGSGTAQSPKGGKEEEGRWRCVVRRVDTDKFELFRAKQNLSTTDTHVLVRDL